ncbi:MAG: hypothetical protein JRF33_15675 [Deltaproteobacteria bacterium]|nr:hypothetical protein [Deltaproteobacteria bacterium]
MRDWKSWMVLSLILAFCSTRSNPARADEYNHRNVIVGERAAGMGGAATALAEDASTAYYNPAGLVLSYRKNLSLSATLLQTRTRFVADYLGTEGVDQTSMSIIAASWCYATDLWGGRFAFSILVPDSHDFQMDEVLTARLTMPDGSNLVGAHLIRQKQYDSYILGPSMAWSLGEKWSIGFSFLFFYRTYIDRMDDTFLYDTGAITEIIDDASGWSLGVESHLGLMWQPLEELRFGLLARLGGSFTDHGKRRLLRIESSAASPGSFSRVTVGDEFGDGDDVKSESPTSFSFGMALRVSKDWLLAIDSSFYLPMKYERLGRLISMEFTWNIAVGAEVILFDAWPLRFGFFTNNSAAPGVDRSLVSGIDPATYTRDDVPAEKIDYYGVTLSLGKLGANSTIDVALQFALGTGERVEVLATGAAVHAVLDTSFGLTISGSYIFDDSSEEPAKDKG